MERLSRLEAVLAANQAASSDIYEISALAHPINSSRQEPTQAVSDLECLFSEPTGFPSNSVPPSDWNEDLEVSNEYDIGSALSTTNVTFSTDGQICDQPLDLSVSTHSPGSSKPISQRSSFRAVASLTTQSQQSVTSRQHSGFDTDLCSPNDNTDPLRHFAGSPDEPEEAGSVYTEETVSCPSDLSKV